MEDKEEEQPTCSKKNSPRGSNHDLRDKKGDKKDDGRRDDDRSESSAASNYSSNSRMEMAKTMSKAPLEKKDLKISGHDGKKRMRNSGRVTKRSPPTRRQPKRACRRRPKPRMEKKRRVPSVSTVFTRLSSASSFGSVCKYCRRYYEMRRVKNRRIAKRRKIRRKTYPPLNFVKSTLVVNAQNRASRCLQAGSRGMMLSPLVIKENDPPLPESEARQFCEITPEMIHFSLRELMMWRHDVEITRIAEYLKNHYPVCENAETLLEELREKLRIAAIVGIVIESSIDRWSLSTTLCKRKLRKNHVTLFWKLYGDTMKPITKKPIPEPRPEIEETNPNDNTIV